MEGFGSESESTNSRNSEGAEVFKNDSSTSTIISSLISSSSLGILRTSKLLFLIS